MRDFLVLPRPRAAAWTDAGFVLDETARVCAPPEIADLVRELLGPATGLPLADGGPGESDLAFDLIEDGSLGDEGYRLTVTERGIKAAAATTAGLCWAVQTIRQLLPVEVYASSPISGVTWSLPGVQLQDGPRLPWRGALLDVARWCQPLAWLFQFVELMAIHKLNVLHLHLTDDQGWRFESKKYPRLTEVGGWRAESALGHGAGAPLDGQRHGGFYSQADLRSLVRYAARRGVRVMPEIDLPGHMQAAISAYPELGNDPTRQLPVRPTWGISRHVLNVEESTTAFVRDVLDEVMDVFPAQYVHLGGDEVPLDEWLASPRVANRITELGLADANQIVGWWIAQMGGYLAEHGRKIAAWDEAVEAKPPGDALIFAWQSADRVQAALDAGHQVIAVPQEYVYLDDAQTDSPTEPMSNGGPLPLSRVYGYEPVPARWAGRILGTQGMLWAEYMPTPRLMQWRAFPRLTAIAATAWSAHRDESDFLARLRPHLRRLDQLGVVYHPGTE
jgi:hexosaminidase